MEYQIKTKNYNEELPDMILHDLLKDRGITDPVKWLYPQPEYEHSPYLLLNMKKAVNILANVMKNKESNITVVVDSDMDGYTSGAIILILLNMICSSQEINYVLHTGKEHGIELKDISNESDLIIVPDASSSEKDKHLELLHNGTKLIILDHHETDNDFDYGNFNDNIAIVNSQIDYDNNFLSGAGVALKFVQAYCWEKGIKYPKYLYALAACGIIADVMDISNLENKRIVDEGLSVLAEHPFLYNLIKSYNQKKDDIVPTVKDVGWIIGPNINSIIRLGTQEQKKIILESLINPNKTVLSNKRGHEDEYVPVYEEGIRICGNAKDRQSHAITKSIKIIEDDLKASNNDNAIVYLDNNQELTFELSGLIANKLLSQYNKPTILLRRYKDDKVDEFRGSVRGKSVEGLDNLREFILNITGVKEAQGHANAFGIHIDKDSYSEFKLHLNEALSAFDFNSNLYLIDSLSKYNKVNIEMAKIFADDGVWSHGVEKPLSCITDVRIAPSGINRDFSLMGANSQHISIHLDKYDIVIFNANEIIDKIDKGEKFNLDVVGEYSVDKVYNLGRLQLIAKDYEIKEYTPPSIDDMIF